jgi:hypothetical protein
MCKSQVGLLLAPRTQATAIRQCWASLALLLRCGVLWGGCAVHFVCLLCDLRSCGYTTLVAGLSQSIVVVVKALEWSSQLPLQAAAQGFCTLLLAFVPEAQSTLPEVSDACWHRLL